MCRCILSVWDQSCPLSVGQVYNQRISMCVSHAQISYFHRPYVMERMQNGGSGSTVFGRAFMPCVEETSSQRYKVELKQVMKSLDAWHQLKDKLAKIGPSITEEVDLIGEE